MSKIKVFIVFALFILLINSFFGVMAMDDNSSFTMPTVVDTVPYSKENFHLYLFIGQSNMSGRADIEDEDMITMERTYLLNRDESWEYAQPGIVPGAKFQTVQGYNRYSAVESKANGLNCAPTFAKTVVNSEKNIGVGIISNAVGNTKLSQWQKDAADGLYKEAVRRTKEAMKYGTLKAIIWHQGEADVRNDQYLQELKTMVTDLRADLGVTDDVPFIAGQCLPTSKYSAFNTRILNIKDFITNSDYVKSDGLTDKGDATHFNSESQRILGKRYAEKVLKMVYNQSVDIMNNLPGKLENAIVLFVGNAKAYVNNRAVNIDQENAEVTPVIVEGRTLVPLRFISESFGAQVEWSEQTSTVSLEVNGKVIMMKMGDKKIMVNGKEQELDIPIQSIHSRTMIPLRAMAELLGKQVFWDDRGLIVISDENNIFNKTDADEILKNR